MAYPVCIYTDASYADGAKACDPVGVGWEILRGGKELTIGAKVVFVPRPALYGELVAVLSGVLAAAWLVELGHVEAGATFVYHTDHSGLASALCKKVPARYCKRVFRDIWGLSEVLGTARFTQAPRHSIRVAHNLARRVLQSRVASV